MKWAHTIAVAMEAGIAKFGDAQAAINLVREVEKGPRSDAFWEAARRSPARCSALKECRLSKARRFRPTIPAVFTASASPTPCPMGADHTAGYAVTANILGVGGKVDPLSPEGQVELSRNLQIATAAVDSTGMCLFIAFAVLDQPETFQALIDMINAFYGLNLTADGVVELGKTVLKTERNFNARAGFTAKDDRLPEFFKKEALPPHNVTFRVTDEELDKVFNW